MVRLAIRKMRSSVVVWTGATAWVLLTAVVLYARSSVLESSFDPRAFICSSDSGGVQVGEFASGSSSP